MRMLKGKRWGRDEPGATGSVSGGIWRHRASVSRHLLAAIASIVLLLAFVWVVWVTLGNFRAWQDGKASLFDLAWSALRASIILMVLGFYLR